MPLSYDPTATNFAGSSVNNDAFYKVAFNGSYAGQANVLTAYYRVGLGGLPGGLNFGGADILANLCYSQIWKAALQSAYNNQYTLQNITVQPYNAQFDLMYSAPYIFPVDESGLSAQQPSGSAPCAIVRYNLEGTALGINGFKPPKRAYSAFGPTGEGDTDSNGRFTTVFRDFLAQKFQTMTEDLVSVLPLISYFPIRVSQVYVLGVPVLQGFADILVDSAQCRAFQSFRRSRVQEA